jgi:cytochrome d ubiquinol oxidase subunit II
MSAELLVAGLGLIALLAYAVLGGADFGGGIWDLFATGPRRRAQRDAIARAMGPVWEANHVWLIFVIVIIFSAFPLAYQALSIALFLPFHLVLLGIILRGAAFVFRAYSPQSARALRAPAESEAKREPGRAWGVVFGVASTMTPVLLGMCLGAVSAGTLRLGAPGEVRIEGTAPWLTPVAWAIGALALALCAYLAAVFLANETEGELREDFRTRALLSGTAVVALSALALPLVRAEAPHLWAGLVGGPGTPVLAIGIVAALLSGWFLRVRRYRAARFAAVAQIIMLLTGWAIAQYPYLIYPDLTLSDAAAPRAVLQFILWSTPAGMLLLLPSLWYLFRVFKGEHLNVRDDARPAP